ncbi:MAG: TonB family protein [Terriglobia bacterium]
MRAAAGTKVDTFDQREPLGKAFAGSLLTHGALVGAAVMAGMLNLKSNWGVQHPSSGSVGVNIVSTIPIPRNAGPTNPLANDTKSIAPQLPTPQKAKPVLKAPPPDAIPLSRRVETPKKLTRAQEAATLFKPQEYKTNQVYSKTPQAANSPLFGMKGSAGIDVGPASVLGTRFGGYVDLMSQRISQKWNTAAINASPSQKCMVSFTISRNGTVSNVQVTRPSGNYLLDTSAKRAILDANPLPALPQQFDKNEVTVELGFQVPN